MSYFDLHLHPSTKPFLSAEEEAFKLNCWEKIPNAINIIRSQSCLDQLKRGNVSLAVTGIYALERPFTMSNLIRYIAPKLTVLDKDFIHAISAGTYTYNELLWKEINHLSKFHEFKGRHFKFLNSIQDLEPGKLNLILSIEGGHALEGRESIGQHLYELKNHPYYRFLYLTLTHLTQFSLCTHAFGMKLINNDAFKPEGAGISPLGVAVIEQAYEQGNGRRIYIDIKHMSLQSRKQFYELRQERGWQNIPIIASHAGMTGISWTRIPDYFKKAPARDRSFVVVKYNKPSGIGDRRFLKNEETYFNPWSINLYDEEILQIIASDGIIGISMDQRILGFGRVSGEYFSAAEFEQITQINAMSLPLATAEDLEEDREAEFEVEQEPMPVTAGGFNQNRHLRYLCNNILHVVKVGGQIAWEHICIGSDFDGLINPVNCCTSTLDYEHLENVMADMLKEMLDEIAQEQPQMNLTKKEVQARVRMIMYDNAFMFLNKYYL